MHPERAFGREFDMEYQSNPQKIEIWRKMEAIDKVTADHCLRVSQYVYILALCTGLSSKVAQVLREDSLLHDTGRIQPHLINIAHKNGGMTSGERAYMKKHTLFGSNALRNLGLHPASIFALNHHERWDGSGYPNQKKGIQIPFGSRITAVADEWDALTNDRPYRPALDPEYVFHLMSSQFGQGFDPNLYAPFCEMVRIDGAIRRQWPVYTSTDEDAHARWDQVFVYKIGYELGT